MYQDSEVNARRKVALSNSYALKKYLLRMCIALFISLTQILIFGCEKKMEAKNVEINVGDIRDEAVEALANKRIVFGHASVGNNIIDGIRDIMSTDDRFKKIHIRELKPREKLDEPGLYHFGLRENSFPKKKCDHFKQILEIFRERGLDGKIDIAFLKLCYVDIEEDSNVQDIFNYYVDTTDYLGKEFPSIKILHVTVPLYAHRWGLKGFIKRLIKSDAHNIKRNAFNIKLLEKYKHVDVIFDLARVESTYPDGRRSSFKLDGKVYYALVNEYTYDGGHLNELGRYYTAKELLKVLSGMAMSQ